MDVAPWWNKYDWTYLGGVRNGAPYYNKNDNGPLYINVLCIASSLRCIFICCIFICLLHPS